MLSIDEAIAMLKFNNKHIADLGNDDLQQIAEWLEQLKDYQDKNKMVVRIDVENMDSIKDKIEELSKYAESQYDKAIDDFTGKIKENISESLIWGMIANCFKYKNMNDTSDKIVDYVINTANEIAEHLKAGGNP